MQKTILSLAIGLSFLLGMSACQPKSDTSSESSETKNTEQVNTPTPLEKSATKTTTATDSTLDAKTCLALSDAMKKVDNSSKVEAIYAIQKQLKACLPTASNAEVLNLLKDYQAMYERFLLDESDLNNSEFDQDFFDVMNALEQGEKVAEEKLKNLSPRVRYLIGLIQNGADVRVYNLGEGYYAFNHDLKAMADIFTPYLRPDQKAFIQRMAKDATNYLNFMALSDSERQEQYPAPSTTEDGYEMDKWATTHYQLNQAMQIPPIWHTDGDNRECLNGLFCQTESVD